jgi:hypothetical protein
MFFIIISALHVSGSFSARHQESMTKPKAAQFHKLLTMGRETTQNM